MPVIIDQVLRAGEGRILRKLQRIAKQVNSIEEDFIALGDGELRELTHEYKRRLADGETLDDLLPEAFATVREAAKRTLGQRHFDVQIMGGAAMHWGNIAEMKTGEGKTLVSTLPIYLNALTEDGVHVVTVNDYLAKRDAEWMGRIYHFLGLNVGVILAQMPPDERRKAYAADVTYGTNNEFGFDYLRDNMAWSQEELVQRGHHFAIVDEVDSILIDEARTPLIISGPVEQSARWYVEFARIVPRLRRETDYEVDEKKRTVGILESGVEKVEDILGIDNLYDPVNTPLVSFLNNALKAKELFKRDKDYVITNGEVQIVDEFTGRILHGRRYNEGLHQAIEAKESVEIQDENQTQATITLQNYFRLYDKLAGMTGTAQTEASEFQQIYKLGVVPIPTNEPMIRADQADVVYKNEAAKFNALVDDIADRHEKGQPMLVGTTSVEKSELLSTMLKRRGVAHEVLNAKHHEREAAIVAQAGRKGSVTVATNMAGRGTDIMLGGNPEFMADVELHQRGLSPLETPEDYEAAWPGALEKAKRAVAEEHDEVVGLGGLYVVGTERHESRRIDNQLRGRGGRQGDPGETRFYLSLGDDLMRLFNSARVETIMGRLNIPDDMPIESKMVTNAVKSAQHQVEQQNFEIRKNVLKYDEVLNRQRQVIYAERRKVLEGEDLREQVRKMIDDVVDGYVQGETTEGFPEEWDLERLWKALGQLYSVDVRIEELEEASGGGRGGLSAEFIAEEIKADAQAAYERREEELGGEVMRELERRVVLSVLDRKWREHLYEMDYLQEGIGLRAMAQRDPLIEYQREGFDMFNAMLDGIKEESVSLLFHLQVEIRAQTSAEQAAGDGASGTPAAASAEAPAGAASSGGVPSGTASGAAGSRAAGPSAGAAAASGGPSPTRATTPTGAPPSGDGAVSGDSAASADGTAGSGEQSDHPEIVARGLGEPQRPSRLEYSSPTVDGTGEPDRRSESSDGDLDGKTPRNAPCPCGSGKKYKRCHGDPRMRAS